MNRNLCLLLSASFALVACDQRAAIQKATNDYTIGVSDVCNVHNMHMAKASDSLEYGLVSLDQSYLDWCAAREVNFPNTTGEHLAFKCGGEPTNIVIYVCKKCEQMKALERVKRNWKN